MSKIIENGKKNGNGAHENKDFTAVLKMPLAGPMLMVCKNEKLDEPESFEHLGRKRILEPATEKEKVVLQKDCEAILKRSIENGITGPDFYEFVDNLFLLMGGALEEDIKACSNPLIDNQTTIVFQPNVSNIVPTGAGIEFVTPTNDKLNRFKREKVYFDPGTSYPPTEDQLYTHCIHEIITRGRSKFKSISTISYVDEAPKVLFPCQEITVKEPYDQIKLQRLCERVYSVYRNQNIDEVKEQKENPEDQKNELNVLAIPELTNEQLVFVAGQLAQNFVKFH